MLLTVAGMVKSVRFSQPENAHSSMLLTESGMVTLVSAVHIANIPLVMRVSPFESTADFKLVHSEKANFPIEITLSGMVMLVKELH